MLGRERRCRSSGQPGITVRADETVAWDEPAVVPDDHRRALAIVLDATVKSQDVV